jgi:putative membrane fusion protein
VRDVEQLEVSRSVNVRFPDIHDDVVRGQVYHLGERERNGLVLVVVKLEEAPDALAVRREVEVLVVLETYRGTVVPRRALLGRNGRTGVLVVVRNTARFQAVEVLGGDARQVVVTGLPAGTEVVLNPWLLREGSRIR